MTVESELGVVQKVSEIRFRNLRIVRIVCHDAGEETTCRIIAFVEERSARENPRKITEEYLIDKTGVGHIGTAVVIAYTEDEGLNDAAQQIFSKMQGRNLNDTYILRLIEEVIDAAGRLALMRPISL